MNNYKSYSQIGYLEIIIQKKLYKYYKLPNSELLGKDFSLLLNEQKQYYID